VNVFFLIKRWSAFYYLSVTRWPVAAAQCKRTIDRIRHSKDQAPLPGEGPAGPVPRVRLPSGVGTKQVDHISPRLPGVLCDVI